MLPRSSAMETGSETDRRRRKVVNTWPRDLELTGGRKQTQKAHFGLKELISGAFGSGPNLAA